MPEPGRKYRPEAVAGSHPHPAGPEAGFTLLEVLVSILILGLLSGAIFTSYHLAVRAANTSDEKLESVLAMQEVVEWIKSEGFSYWDLRLGGRASADLSADLPPGLGSKYDYRLLIERQSTLLLKVDVTQSKGEQDYRVVLFLGRGHP